MNRKERILAVCNGREPDRTPTGFWMHFPEETQTGQVAVDTHLEYFEKSRTDVCKVMNENLYPCDYHIENASDWKQIKVQGRNSPFIQKQVELVKRVVDSMQGEAPVIATVHGVVASASHALLSMSRYDKIGRYAQLYHLRTDPHAIHDAYKAIAETLTVLSEECLKAGADGIYYAALGGERDGFSDEEHAAFIAPLEKELLNAIGKPPVFHILHMCKPLVNLHRFADYPCDVVNWGVLESGISLAEGHKIFPEKIIMGGLDNGSPALLSGSFESLEKEVHKIIQENEGFRFILASDCTLPGDLPYDRIAMVTRACETYRSKQSR